MLSPKQSHSMPQSPSEAVLEVNLFETVEDDYLLEWIDFHSVAGMVPASVLGAVTVYHYTCLVNRSRTPPIHAGRCFQLFFVQFHLIFVTQPLCTPIVIERHPRSKIVSFFIPVKPCWQDHFVIYDARNLSSTAEVLKDSKSDLGNFSYWFHQDYTDASRSSGAPTFQFIPV